GRRRRTRAARSRRRASDRRACPRTRAGSRSGRCHPRRRGPRTSCRHLARRGSRARCRGPRSAPRRRAGRSRGARRTGSGSAPGARRGPAADRGTRASPGDTLRPYGMIGETIGRFELKSRLGEGPFGEVWLGGHRETHNAVAIKLLRRDVSAHPMIPALVTATRSIARVSNPSVAKVYDVGVDRDRRMYIVSRLLTGPSLGQRCAPSRFSQTQVADVVAQIARALAAAKSVGVLHHDLKPSNVLLVPDEDRPTGERVVVLDFGLAALIPANLERAASAYVAPELW